MFFPPLPLCTLSDSLLLLSLDLCVFSTLFIAMSMFCYNFSDL